jgi:hypothetical protein
MENFFNAKRRINRIFIQNDKELFVVTCCTIYHKRVSLKILLDISKSIYSTSQNGIHMGAGGGGHVNSI